MKLQLPGLIQLVTALAFNADVPTTHNREIAKVMAWSLVGSKGFDASGKYI